MQVRVSAGINESQSEQLSEFDRIEGFLEHWNFGAKTRTVPGKFRQLMSPWVMPLARWI